MKKVMICYASIGSGHRVAAEAIRDALFSLGNIDAVLVDVLEPLQGRLQKVSEIATMFAQFMVPRIYDWAWRSERLGHFYTRMPAPEKLRVFLLSRYRSYAPDLVVCTHALPCSILSKEKEWNRLSTPIIAVATDFQVHPYWPLRHIAHFIVGSEVARSLLVSRGMAANQISMSGIPIRAQFVEHLPDLVPGQDPARIRQVLVLAGGKQAAPYVTVWPRIISLIRHLGSSHACHAHWTVVTGDNRWLERLLKWLARDNPRITITGYVEKMADLLSGADFILTKPGGLTLAECLSLHKPIVLLSRGAGQEAANADYLLNRGAALLAEDPEEVVKVVEQILMAEEGSRLAQNAAALAYPQAAMQIASAVCDLWAYTYTDLIQVAGQGIPDQSMAHQPPISDQWRREGLTQI
jgi:processive 1,2-diacylglycerol beta-glucosyltransferase